MSVPVDDATVAVQISTHSLFSVKHKFQIPGDLPMRGSGGGLPRVKLNLLSHMHVVLRMEGGAGPQVAWCCMVGSSVSWCCNCSRYVELMLFSNRGK